MKITQKNITDMPSISTSVAKVANTQVSNKRRG